MLEAGEQSGAVMVRRIYPSAAYCAAAAIVFAAAIMFAGIEPLTAAQSARMELRKIADNVYVMQNPTGASNAMFVVR